jgi:hypothetical protein
MQLTDMTAERMRTLQEIDSFENLWFPRMRTLIPRLIPKDNAARFTAAFFEDLSQKPLGPEVVDAVKTFLNRVEELKSSTEPGARKLYKTLGERGLTPKKIEAMRGLIATAEEHKAPAGGASPASLTEIAKARRRSSPPSNRSSSGTTTGPRRSAGSSASVRRSPSVSRP